MRKICTVYTFKAETCPHGIVMVARLTQYHCTDEDNKELMIDFPSRYMEEHPNCTEVLGISEVNFIDDSNRDAKHDKKHMGSSYGELAENYHADFSIECRNNLV